MYFYKHLDGTWNDSHFYETVKVDPAAAISASGMNSAPPFFPPPTAVAETRERRGTGGSARNAKPIPPPNHLRRMPDMFTIGQENLLFFRIIMLAGSALALWLGWHRCARAEINRRKTMLSVVLLPFFVMFFSHLLYCLMDVEYTLYSYSFGYLFAFWEQGHMLYGGITGRRNRAVPGRRQGRPDPAGAVRPRGALMIAVARIGEGLLGQGSANTIRTRPFSAVSPSWVYDP
jgi:hypothetical protein